ncbi:MAG: aspartate aminotransferase family protein [Planctomycetota bacterium]|nr:MAG: aspartate aminotransferase family protein [Planctomycetota bacterium]
MSVPQSDFQRLTTDALANVDTNYANHLNPHFAKLLRLTGFDRRYVRGDGARLFDDTGAEYIDCIAGYAVHGIGRAHPAMIAALQEALQSELPNWIQFERNPLAALLARRLSARMPGELTHAFFSNSGTEAVECALKLARRATRRDALLHCTMSFHGLTLGALAANGNPHLRDGFGVLGESTCIPFDDLPALEKALSTRRFAAFLVEPVQGKSCRAVSDGYLAEASRLCALWGTLLIVDEVQTGIGRTGRFLALEHDPKCRPDIVVLSKALAGGFVPVGATLVRRDIWRETFDSMSNALVHSSTFQCGVLAMTAALMTLEIHDAEQLSQRAERMGGLLRRGFEECVSRHDAAAEVRGRGLMLGVALQKNAVERFLSSLPLVGSLERVLFGQAFAMEMVSSHRVLCQVSESQTNILKFTPPLVIDESQCARVVGALDATLFTLHNATSPTLSGALRAIKQVS